jgi:uncharacterized membrane protein YidH (DUF202 family)
MSRVIGILLIAVGLVAAIGGGFWYKKREKILDVGPIEATRTSERYFPISPAIGVATIIAGVVLVAVRKR